MSRTATVVLLAFLGALIAFATALPSARSASPARVPAGEEVPLEWIAKALSEMPLIFPPGR